MRGSSLKASPMQKEENIHMTNRGDCIAGVGVTALAVLVYYEASKFPEAAKGLGAGGFPKFIAVCMGILGLILAVTSYMKLQKNRDQEKQVIYAKDLLGAGMMALAFWLYVILVKPLGYVIATSLFSAVFMIIYGERRWIRLLVVCIGFSVIAYFLFRNVFYVMLPAGRIL